MKNVIIVGAGPAGILAAISAKNENNNVILLDKNEKIGKKLFITGKGRCNITNFSDIEDFFPMINTNSKFMYSSLYKFTNKDILELLKAQGLKYKVERGNRVFPESDKSSDVLKAFSKILANYEVNVVLNQNVKYIEKINNFFKVYTNNNTYIGDFLVIATGGLSYPITGSSGDGYKFAKNFQHSIKSLKPNLVPLEVENNKIQGLQGVSLRNVEVSVVNNNQLIYKEFGELIFTHFGLSGPIILKSSNYIPLNGITTISIDLKPRLDFETLDKRIQKDFEKYNNKNIENGLNDLLIKKMIPIVLKDSCIDPKTKINQITKEQRKRLIETIKGIKFIFKDFRPIKEAIITKGGISVKEINSKTMESKIEKNLYFAGEIIDVDAMTGGYNLQIAYSTGFSAGNSIKEKCYE